MKKDFDNIHRCRNQEDIDYAMRQYKETINNFHGKTGKQNQKRDKVIAAVDSHLDDFIDFLGADGYLVIQLLESNAGELVADSAVVRLFSKWLQDNEDGHQSTDSADANRPRCHSQRH